MSICVHVPGKHVFHPLSLTGLQSDATSQWEHRLVWQGCVEAGGRREEQWVGCTMVERFPNAWRHWSCLCWRP